MNGPDDSSRERPNRPTSPPPSQPAAEGEDHAIPFGQGVYGLGGRRPQPDPRDETPPHGDPLDGEAPPPSPPPGGTAPESEFDFRRLAAELGFDGHTEGRRCVGFCPVCRGADVLRAVATPELRAAWGEFQHELARALRAAAERYAAAEPAERPERITEIPID